MIAALVEVAAERGVGQVTVAHIVARSGVSRRTFYELFADRDDCFLAAFELAVEHAAGRVLPAFAQEDQWRERVRAGLGALLGFLEDDPGMAALVIIDTLAAGPVALARRARLVDALIDVVDLGRSEARGAAKPTRFTAEGVVGAVLAVLYARLSAIREGSVSRAGEDGSLIGLLGPLMGLIVLPYQGQAVAAREAARPTPRRSSTGPVHGSPLRELDMRLTYRTVRVLAAVATYPDASNRQIADAAGVVDQGQISKLLMRLEHVGLIHNRGAAGLRGEPNAWSLTARGEGVAHAIGQQAVRAVG